MKKLKYYPTLNLLFSALFLLFSGCCTDGKRTELKTMQKTEWISGLRDVFDGISLRMNNYTPDAHYYERADSLAFYKPNDSYLTVEALGIDVSFAIPVQRNDPYSIYINDVNSTGFVLDARGGRGIVTINFEEDGTEIIGNCVDNFFCFCGAPQVNLNDMKIDVLLTFGARGGRLIISEIQSKLSSTYEETGPCVDNACAFACDIFASDRESEARASIEEQVVHHFENYRGIIESLFNDHLQTLGVSGEITSATIGGKGELLLTLTQPDASCE